MSRWDKPSLLTQQEFRDVRQLQKAAYYDEMELPVDCLPLWQRDDYEQRNRPRVAKLLTGGEALRLADKYRRIPDKKPEHAPFWRGTWTGTKEMCESDNDNGSRGPNGDYYPYIPFGPVDFASHLLNVAGLTFERELSFLDVGGGIGDKAWLAYVYGAERADIVEYNHELVSMAGQYRSQCGAWSSNMKFHECDAFDFDGYGNYDILYWYVPINNYLLMDKLAHYVIPQMKDGAVFISEGYFTHMKREGDTWLMWGRVNCDRCIGGYNMDWVEFDLATMKRFV